MCRCCLPFSDLLIHQRLQIPNTAFILLLDKGFPLQNNPRIQDPSYKTDLDFWDCFHMENPILQPGLVNWLVAWMFWVQWPFETVFQSISDRLQERTRKQRELIDGRKNTHTTHTRRVCRCPTINPQKCRIPRH